MKAVLFIHGFSALNEDNLYFIDYLKNHKKIDIYSFTLPGHDKKIMGKVKYIDWEKESIKQIELILKKYNEITLVGHSMGAVLAIKLATMYVQVKQLVLIAPGFKLGNKEQVKIDMKNIISKTVDEKIGTGFEGVFKKFLTVPIPRVIEYKKLVNKNINLIEKVKCPTLVMHGTKDNIVAIKIGIDVYDKLNCIKYFTILENIRHQVFKSIKKKEITEYICDFIIKESKFKHKNII